MEKCKILSTKKLPPAFHTALPANVELSVIEFIRIEPLPATEIRNQLSKLNPAEQKNIVFTSTNAVEAVRELPGENKAFFSIFSLSGATKEAVQQKFPGTVISAEADNASALAEKIISAGINDVIFFCGDKRRDELPQLLRSNGIRVHEIIVYNTILQPVAVKESPDAVLFFSPSGADSFFKNNKLNSDAVCIAIGETTGTSLRQYTNNKIITCEQPSKNCMLAAIKEFTSKKN